MEVQGFLETGSENALSFANACIGNASNILGRNTPVRLRDCPINRAEQALWTSKSFDVDGIVVTMKHFKDFKGEYSYFQFLPQKARSLIPVFPILKKHLKLETYNANQLQNLKWSVSVKLLTSTQFDFHMALLPIPDFQSTLETRNQIQKVQYTYYDNFRKELSDVIVSLPLKQLTRPTFKKNYLLDIRKMYILPDDVEYFNEILDKTVLNTSTPDGFEVVLICFTFGRRDSKPVPLHMFSLDNTLISVHVACTMASSIIETNLFWSRSGLLEIIGRRGTMSGALSLRDCANYQSNLDGRNPDIPIKVRRLCQNPENMTFVQFYADTPHLMNGSIHPVYKSVVSGGLMSQTLNTANRQSANDYINAIRENTMKMGTVSSRVEIVSYVTERSNLLFPWQLFNEDHLRELLSQYPLLTLIKEMSEKSKSFVQIIRSVGSFLTEELKSKLASNGDKGGFFSAWRTFQLECANEIFWKGRLNSSKSGLYSVNLGPGQQKPNRSLTWENGFLCLDDCTSCALDEMSAPPLFGVVTHDMGQVMRMKRFLNFSDFLHATDSQLGMRSLLLLLRDIQEDPKTIVTTDRSFLASLKEAVCPRWAVVSGRINVTTLCTHLAIGDGFKEPYTFQRGLALINEIGRDVHTVLRLGVQGLKLKFFPDCRTTDKSRHKRFVWNSNYLLKIIEEDDEKLDEDYVALTLEIIHYMEINDLVHSSKFNAFKDEMGSLVFPWIPEIASRLVSSNFSRHFVIKVATYISCFGLLQNHWFVNFRKLHALHTSIQAECNNVQQLLKRKKILSEHTLSSVITFKAHRLHESIPSAFPEPCKIQDEDEILPIDEQTTELLDEPHEPFVGISIDCSSELEIVHYTDRRGRHAGFTGRWSPQEIECLHTVIQHNLQGVQEAYHYYQSLCAEKNIPDRTFVAFNAKYFRLKK